MAIHDRHIKRTAKVAERTIIVPIITAVSQTDTKALAFTPGHAFEITRVATFCHTVTQTTTADVLIGSTTVLGSDAAFAANTETEATLSTTTTAVRGDDDDQIVVTYTSDADGALTNGQVIITYRIYPLAGEGFEV